MNGPPRKARVPVEATQELQALDVVEIVETLKAPGVKRANSSSNSSIAPVGLDLRRDVGGSDDEPMPTAGHLVPVQRRRLRGVVIAALGGCALILVAAGIARISRAASSPDTPSAAAATATPDSPAATAPTTAAATANTAASPTAAVPAPQSTPTPATAGGSAPSTGTIRLDKPATPGRVWVDGKKLSSSSAMVSCGTHQIRVGLHRKHSIDVPCGGEIGVSK